MDNGEKAVSYMRKMATGCRWKVSREIHYVKSDGSEVVLEPGFWYTGIPYTQGKKKRRYSLFRFRLNLLGGFLFLRKSLVGCDCSSAASFAWRKMNRDIPVLSTRKMYADLCGRQKYFTHGERYQLGDKSIGSQNVIQMNSSGLLYKAYEALSVGDGLLQYDPVEKRGHIMLVSQRAKDEGLKVIDQKGFGEGGSEKRETSWRVDYRYSFDALIDEGYLPIYLK